MSMQQNCFWMVSAVALLALAALVGTAVGAAAAPVVVWESWLGGTGHEIVHGIADAGDGGFLLAGNSTSANGTGDAYLAKIDGNGTRIWEKTYGGAGDDLFMDIVPVEGGFVLVGTTGAVAATPDHLLLVKVDPEGMTVFETNSSGRGVARGLGVVGASDGSCIAVGLSAPSASEPNDVYLIRLDAAGTPSWERYYGGRGEDKAFAIVEAGDGGYAVAGSMTPDGQTVADAYLLKVDSEGRKEWETFYGTGDRQEVGFDLVATADGGFLLVGRSFTGSAWWGTPESSETYVIRTDPSGARLWERTFGGTGFDRAWDGAELVDGYLLFGSKTVADGTEDFHLMKLTEDGAVAWEQNLSPGMGHDRGFALHRAADGGWIVAGSSESKGAGGRDAWVVKLALDDAGHDVTATANVTATATATTKATVTDTTLIEATTVPATTQAPLSPASAFAVLVGATLLAFRRR